MPGRVNGWAKTWASLIVAASFTSVSFAASDVVPSRALNIAPSQTVKIAPSHKVYFTAKAQHGVPGLQPATQFDCSDQVYTVLEASNYPKQDYEVVVTWTDPSGRERERTNYSFVPRAEQTRVWSWLRLHRGAGAAIMSVFDSTAGLDGFVGQWTVAVAVNGKLLQKENFEVLC